jgi:GNAT superfamily N-acetyltransferase
MDDRYVLRKLTLTDAGAVARIHRVAFDERLPWLAGRHTPEEDQWYFRERVLPACEVWGACEGSTIKGFIAFREDWIDHLYVLPDAQGQGLGSALVEQAQSTFPRLSLWTFQRNKQARDFYAAKGFVLVRETEGSANDEHEPDALYTWMRQTGMPTHMKRSG